MCDVVGILLFKHVLWLHNFLTIVMRLVCLFNEDKDVKFLNAC